MRPCSCLTTAIKGTFKTSAGLQLRKQYRDYFSRSLLYQSGTMTAKIASFLFKPFYFSNFIHCTNSDSLIG